MSENARADQAGLLDHITRKGVLLLEANIIFIVIGLLIGVGLSVVFVWIRRKQQQTQLQLAQNTAARIIDEAKKDANAIKK